MIVFFLWCQDILKKVQYLSPRALVIDSVQTVYLKGIMGSPGGIMQVRGRIHHAQFPY